MTAGKWRKPEPCRAAGAVVNTAGMMRDELELWDHDVPKVPGELPVWLHTVHVAFEDEDRCRRENCRPGDRVSGRDHAERFRADLMRRVRAGCAVSHAALKLIGAHASISRNVPPDLADWIASTGLLDQAPRQRGPIPTKGRRNYALTVAVRSLAGDGWKIARGVAAGDRCILGGGSACDVAGLAWQQVTGELVSYKTVEGCYFNNRDRHLPYQFVLRDTRVSK